MIQNHTEPQGSDQWKAMRGSFYGASEAAAMLNLSKNTTRNELLRMKFTKLPKEFTEWTQANVLDYGHEVEAKARPIVEDMIGTELYPVTRSQGLILCSCDGLSFDERIAFEHKQWGESLAASVDNGILPEEHWPQCQQTLMVTGAEKLIFVVSDGTEDKFVFMWVYPDEAKFQKLRDGWRQFGEDLANYVLPPASEPKLVGARMDSLPALRVMVKGEVTETNVDRWAEVARAVLGSINRALNTDQDFADAEQAIKWCEKQEAALEAAKEHALSQTESIDQLFKTIDAIREETRTIRLEQEKLVSRRKTERKTEIVGEVTAAFIQYVREQDEALAPYHLPKIAVDFAGVTKNKRSFDSMQNALDTELARAKIEATNIANAMRANIRKLDAQPAFAFLFNDAATLVLKDPEALSAIIQGRIRDHLDEVERKAVAETARIRAEEKEKAEAAARENAAEILRQEREAQEARDREAKIEAAAQAARDQKAADERRRQDDAARAERDQAEADLQKLGQSGAPVASAVAESIVSSSLESFEARRDPLAAPGFEPAAIQAAVADVAATLAADEPATVSLGKIADCLGFRLDEAFIVETLGIPWRKKDKSSRLWSVGDYDLIQAALIKHVRQSSYIPF